MKIIYLSALVALCILLASCNPDSTPQDPTPPQEKLADFTVTELGVNYDINLSFNDAGDIMTLRPLTPGSARTQLFRYYNSTWQDLGLNDVEIAGCSYGAYRGLEPAYQTVRGDSRYILCGILHDASGTPIPVPGGKKFVGETPPPSNLPSLQVEVTDASGEWVYGFSFTNDSSADRGAGSIRPFRWRIGTTALETLGQAGDILFFAPDDSRFAYDLQTRISGDRNGRMLLVTEIASSRAPKPTVIFETDGSRVDPYANPDKWSYLDLKISDDGSSIGTGRQGEATEVPAYPVAYANGKFTSNSTIANTAGVWMGEALFLDVLKMGELNRTVLFTWSPATGRKDVNIVPPNYDESVSGTYYGYGKINVQKNKRGQWLVPSDYNNPYDYLLLTPK
jgi:hypothetical protein